MRHSFSNKKVALPLPGLSSVQLESFAWLKSNGINEILDELGGWSTKVEDDPYSLVSRRK